MRKLLLICLISLLLITQVGCWNYKEISDRDIVVGVGVDYNETDKKLIQTVEIAAPQMAVGQTQTQIKSKVVVGRGENFFDAARNTISITGKKLFWSHTKILIMGKSAIDNEDIFMSTLDYIKRDAEPRDNMWVVMAKDVNAEDVLTKTDVEVQEIVSLYIDEMFKNQKAVSKYEGIRLWQLINDLGDEGISPVLPTVSMHHDDFNTVCEARGLAVFKGNKLRGYLNGDETLYFLMASDKLDGGIIVVEQEFDKKDTKVSLEIYKCKTKINPNISDGKLSIDLNIQIDVEIGEISNDVDVIEKKKREELEDLACKKIIQSLNALMRKIQKQYTSDIFGYGKKFSIKYPNEWKVLKGDWNSYFKNVDVNISCNVDIIGSAFRSKPIKVGE